jgi:hypothetical protein
MTLQITIGKYYGIRQNLHFEASRHRFAVAAPAPDRPALRTFSYFDFHVFDLLLLQPREFRERRFD